MDTLIKIDYIPVIDYGTASSVTVKATAAALIPTLPHGSA